MHGPHSPHCSRDRRACPGYGVHPASHWHSAWHSAFDLIQSTNIDAELCLDTIAGAAHGDVLRPASAHPARRRVHHLHARPREGHKGRPRTHIVHAATSCICFGGAQGSSRCLQCFAHLLLMARAHMAVHGRANRPTNNALNSGRAESGGGAQHHREADHVLHDGAEPGRGDEDAGAGEQWQRVQRRGALRARAPSASGWPSSALIMTAMTTSLLTAAASSCPQREDLLLTGQLNLESALVFDCRSRW